jgi:hypothetical protein
MTLQVPSPLPANDRKTRTQGDTTGHGRAEWVDGKAGKSPKTVSLFFVKGFLDIGGAKNLIQLVMDHLEKRAKKLGRLSAAQRRLAIIDAGSGAGEIHSLTSTPLPFHSTHTHNATYTHATKPMPTRAPVNTPNRHRVCHAVQAFATHSGPVSGERQLFVHQA